MGLQPGSKLEAAFSDSFFFYPPIGYTCAMPRGDVPILFTTRIVRLFAYGFLSVILAFYLIEVGLDERAVGLLFTFTLVGDAGVSLWLTTSADRIGRRRMLVVGALLMVLAGFLQSRTAAPSPRSGSSG
jgi:MFS family permease